MHRFVCGWRIIFGVLGQNQAIMTPTPFFYFLLSFFSKIQRNKTALRFSRAVLIKLRDSQLLTNLIISNINLSMTQKGVLLMLVLALVMASTLQATAAGPKPIVHGRVSCGENFGVSKYITLGPDSIYFYGVERIEPPYPPYFNESDIYVGKDGKLHVYNNATRLPQQDIRKGYKIGSNSWELVRD
jgi:hypothetical protein